MGDHFWPSMYPGIIVGLLYGLSLGGLVNMTLGALGGLGGALLSYALFAQLTMMDGLLSLAGLIGASRLGAYWLTYAARAATAVLAKNKG